MSNTIFSSTVGNHRFELFSIAHIVMLAIFIGTILLLFIFRRQLRKRSSVVRHTLLFLLLISEGSLNIWYYTSGAWEIKETLPLQLCTISLILSVFMLITRSFKLFEVVYFIGIGGAIQALLTPELAYDFPHYRYFHFFIAHIAIVLSSLYMVLIEGYRPTFKSVFKSMIVLNIIAFFIFLINLSIDANYMFLAAKPDTASLLDLLPAYPWYILYLEVIAFFTFVLFYFPFFFIKHIRKT
jgi:hypothetical integral membrane protein (TIGR02206 family)